MDRIFLFLNEVVDERQKNKVNHTLSDIVMIVFFAHLSKYDTWEEISYFSRKSEYILKKIFSLEKVIPLKDTIRE